MEGFYGYGHPLVWHCVCDVIAADAQRSCDVITSRGSVLALLQCVTSTPADACLVCDVTLWSRRHTYSLESMCTIGIKRACVVETGIRFDFGDSLGGSLRVVTCDGDAESAAM